MVRRAVLSLWAEPRAAAPPPPRWQDAVFVGALLITAALEAVFRDDVVWRALVTLLAVGLAPGLLWRRTHSFVVVVVTFGALLGLNVASIAGDVQEVGLNTMAYVLLLPFALCRWGSGREIVAGLGLITVVGVLGTVAADVGDVGEAVGGLVVLTLPAALGTAVRYRAIAVRRQLDHVVLTERQLLARDLHDTVAHHVSAIAIRAQAGRVVAATDPAAAVDALVVIEHEATRTLAEMRTIVLALRDDNDAALTPQRGVSDIPGLAGGVEGSPVVDVRLAGDLDDLGPAVGVAVYRLAQEAITNARRHARAATRVAVDVVGEDGWVRLTVRDDGEPGSGGRAVPGFGLAGMSERVALLGGTLRAGPVDGRGWLVDATLPRAGTPR